MGGGAVFLIGIPFYKLIRAIVPQKRNVLAEAKERLEQARPDTNGVFGHDIYDLSLEGISINHKNKTIKLEVGS